MEEEEDEVLERWFIESLKAYKDLHVYQLEHPTKVLEWTSGRSICVAGNSFCKSEILELLLPLKLLSDGNKGLCAERDFKVLHGGFTDGAVRCLTHVPGTRCIVTIGGRSSDLQVWELGGDESDVIQRTGSVAGGIVGNAALSDGGGRIAAQLSSQPKVLHGAVSGAVWLTELTSGQSVYRLETDATEPLTSLQFIAPSVFLAGGAKGNLLLDDTRTSSSPQISPPPLPSRSDAALWWTDAAATGMDLSGCRVVRLSSCGDAVLSDLRNLGGSTGGAQLDVSLLHCSMDDVRLSWAPVLDNCLAVSGFSGTVQIYNTSGWGAEPLKAPLPLFEHCGHRVSSCLSADGIPVLITTHVWHPERPRTLLSAGSDGSVHVWDWVDSAHSDAAGQRVL